jgi:hypothetical protein
MPVVKASIYRSLTGGIYVDTAYDTDFFSILAQESLSGRVRLKTRCAGVEPGVESGSRQK